MTILFTNEQLKDIRPTLPNHSWDIDFNLTVGRGSSHIFDMPSLHQLPSIASRSSRQLCMHHSYTKHTWRKPLASVGHLHGEFFCFFNWYLGHPWTLKIHRSQNVSEKQLKTWNLTWSHRGASQLPTSKALTFGVGADCRPRLHTKQATWR